MAEGGKIPGWIDRIRLRERLRWVADAPIGSPQIFVTKTRTSVIPNKFVRQSDWFNRLYTHSEMERIQKRSEIPEGMANTVLQKYRSKEEKKNLPPKVAVSKRSDTKPLMEELADEQVLLDPLKFEELAEQLNAVSRKDLVDSKNPCSPLICQRCHDLKSNENILTLSASSTEGPQLLLSERDKRIVREEMNSRSLVVLVADLSNLPSSIPSSAVSLLKTHLKFGEEFPSILVVGNKVDLLPKHLKNAESYLLQLARDKIGPEGGEKILGAHLISAKEGTGIAELRRHLLKLSSERDGNIFLVGRTNAGKSLVFNSIIGRKDTNRATATVSAKAGTTIGAIKNRLCSLSWADGSLKINPLRVIVDLPGIIDETESLLSVLTPEEAKRAIVSNRIRQLRRKLAPGETALFGGLIRIACEGNDPKIEVMLKLCMRPDWYYFRVP
ncbi:GTPase, partial [Paramicrosporidium saccamoebae]